MWGWGGVTPQKPPAGRLVEIAGGEKFGGAGLGMGLWHFLGRQGAFGVGGTLRRSTVVALEMPPGLYLHPLWLIFLVVFFCFSLRC